MPRRSCRHPRLTDDLRRRSAARTIAASVVLVTSVTCVTFAASAAAEPPATPTAASPPEPTPDWYTPPHSAPSPTPRPDTAPAPHATAVVPRVIPTSPVSAPPATPQQREMLSPTHGLERRTPSADDRVMRHRSKVPVPNVFRLNLAALAAAARPVGTEQGLRIPPRAALALFVLVVLSAVFLLFTMRAERTMRSSR
jgi:hypothetical protein